ncbi:bleomycin resistance protein [Bordetella genomosp. 4]|uniref:bleomycin resistance protein n=1 Tax=Bordetella genomosp. 4 TaxID=463044 RepID=UPI001594FF4E|nr:VOC family protein [Bordetella genomosp. 4]
MEHIMEELQRAQMVPELLVSDLPRSLAFWIDVCGFETAYRREEDGFIYLNRDGAQFMLVEVRGDDYWITGPLEPPLGRGINFEINVASIDSLLDKLAAAKWPLYREPQEWWHRSDNIELGVRQFLVQDPDGYLLRFSARVGVRPVSEPLHG